MAAYFSQIPDFTLLVLVDGKINSRNPLLKELNSIKARVKSFPLLKYQGLRQWIERRVTAAGGTISAQAVDLMARFVGNNLWVMAGEVDKLVLYTMGKRIEEEDVRTVVSYAQEANIFATVDAILEFRTGVAEKLLEQLIQQGAAPAYLLVMLSR
ncbi:DNA polymerase III subunit delta [Chloroflexota bacterium]